LGRDRGFEPPPVEDKNGHRREAPPPPAKALETFLRHEEELEQIIAAELERDPDQKALSV
jgi:hypothetical protein